MHVLLCCSEMLWLWTWAAECAPCDVGRGGRQHIANAHNKQTPVHTTYLKRKCVITDCVDLLVCCGGGLGLAHLAALPAVVDERKAHVPQRPTTTKVPMNTLYFKNKFVTLLACTFWYAVVAGLGRRVRSL